jgi:hypothetical protein
MFELPLVLGLVKITLGFSDQSVGTNRPLK